MYKMTRSAVALFVTFLIAGLVGSAQALDKPILERQIESKNGLLPVSNDEDKEFFRQVVEDLRSQSFHRLVIRGVFSDMPWVDASGRPVPPKYNNSLDGGISTERVGKVVGKFLMDAGMTEAEKDLLHIHYVPDNTQTQAGEPYVKVTVVEDTELTKLKEEFGLWKEEVNGVIVAISDKVQAISEKLKRLSEPLILSYHSKAGLGKPSEASLVKIQEIVDASNANENLFISVTAPTAEALVAVRTFLRERGLSKLPIETTVETDTDYAEQPIFISLPWNAGTFTPVPPSAKRGASQKRVNVKVGVSIHTAGGWNEHLTPGVSETKQFPTVDLRLDLGSTSFICKAQLPGDLFENAGGKLTIAQMQFVAKLLGPICVTGSWENFVTRKPYETPLAAGQELAFKEGGDGWALGAQFNGNLTQGTGLLRSLSFGVDLLFLDRTYELPAGGNSTFKFKSDGDTQLRGYLSYHLPLFSF